MFSRTDALYSALRADLKDHLNPDQFASAAAGEEWWPDATWQQVASHQLVSKVTSKLVVGGQVPDAACQAALAKFLACNQKCKDFSLVPETLMDEVLIGELRACLWDFFNPQGYPLLGSLQELVALGGVGPGASVSCRGDDLYTKVFDGPLSSTSESLLYTWEHTVCEDDRWFAALYRSYQKWIPTTVGGSKLSFVMKNTKVARTICTEPTINQWFQLGIGRKLEKRLAEFFGISLSSQTEINREMARLASLGGDFATLDLASASDSLSLGLLRAILPAEVCSWFELTRSPSTQLPDGRTVDLHLVGSMGNGFTFPLQTLIFAAVVQSVYRTLGLPLIKRGSAENRTFAVFGDDIICSKRAYRAVVRLLATCGFTVNAEKSFSQGLFYESCGSDWFSGHFVRAFYIKALETTTDFYKAINGLNRWSALMGISLEATVQYLMSLLRNPKLVPLYESDDAGVHVPLVKARALSAAPGLWRYTAMRPVKRYLLVKEDVIACGRGVKKRGYNPDGLWLSFLFGCVRGYRIALRQRETRYRTKREVTPSWDSPSPLHLRLGIGVPSLTNSVITNLGWW